MEQTVTAVDIQALLPSWQRSLKAARRSPRTIQSYTEAAEQLSDFLVRNGMPTAVADIHREHVEAFIVDLAEHLRSFGQRIRLGCGKWMGRSCAQTVSAGEDGRGPSPDPPYPTVPAGRLGTIVPAYPPLL